MTDDIIHSTKYYIKYINSAIFVNFQQKPLKLGRLMVLNAMHSQLKNFRYHGNLLFSSSTRLISIF